MRIQTRLFLGTAALVLALMAVQWWLHARQLRAIERDLGRVATSVGKEILSGETAIFREKTGPAGEKSKGLMWVGGAKPEPFDEGEESEDPESSKTDVRVMVIPQGSDAKVTRKLGRTVVHDEEGSESGVTVQDTYEWKVEADQIEFVDGQVHHTETSVGEVPNVRRLVLQVEGGEADKEHFLVVSEDDHRLHRFPIPVSPTIERVRGTMREGAAVGGVLLLAGLFASAVLSRRVTRPLRDLVEGAEAVGRGDLGVQVPVSASGEIGELQQSFNRMSHRLTELEAERDRWQQREHLAQLGDVSRGLAHTLRNPLHTLGLAVEELADGEHERYGLVETARAQIRRIDHWLRSFLALGAEEAAEPVPLDLGDLVQSVALESVQQGAEVRVDTDADELIVKVVPGAVRAALANLVENATEASPKGEQVMVQVVRDGGDAVVNVKDSGPGLPEEVRERLFSPHVTTKAGGSGMGLFLARQLLVGMHGGRLEVEDGAEGGTIATIRLPLVDGCDDRGDDRG
jgi:signal transduction histidine kinase